MFPLGYYVDMQNQHEFLTNERLLAYANALHLYCWLAAVCYSMTASSIVIDGCAALSELTCNSSSSAGCYCQRWSVGMEGCQQRMLKHPFINSMKAVL
jgi:hypothetical protein